MKYVSTCLLAVITLISMAAAQSANPHSSSTKPLTGRSSADTSQTATKPLTPKSAMPAQRKSPAVTPHGSASAKKSNAELAGLERKNVAASHSQKQNARKTNSGATPKTASQTGSGINFKYQKPKAGMQAPNQGGNSKNPGSRIKKTK